MDILYLDREDDIVSICDRLEWVRKEQRVLLVIPGDRPPILVEWLDLVRLRRCAEKLRLEIGLVCRDRSVAAKAVALGLPTFRSVAAAERGRRAWWRWRRARREPTRPGATVRLGEREQIKSLPDDADRREMYRRMTPHRGWQRWLWRYLGIFLFFLALSFFFVGVAYSVPGAMVTLHPHVEQLRVSRPITADPALESVDPSGGAIPGSYERGSPRGEAGGRPSRCRGCRRAPGGEGDPPSGAAGGLGSIRAPRRSSSRRGWRPLS